jgi:D-3-phosphoglycerate dehydrogenase
MLTVAIDHLSIAESPSRVDGLIALASRASKARAPLGQALRASRGAVFMAVKGGVETVRATLAPSGHREGDPLSMTTKLRVAICDDYQGVALGMADWSRLGPDIELVSFNRLLAGDEAVAALRDFDVLCLMRERMAVPRALLERLSRLRFIAITGSHAGVVDAAAAAELGIGVALTDPAPSASAAEHTWALVLALARHIVTEDRNMREGRWQTTLGFRLQGRTLGLIGLGTLGSRVAAYGRAFDMKVIAWSANLTAERAAAAGATLVGKDELLAEADVISVQLKLSDRSRGLIGAREFGLMKPSAVIVNTSRGPIIDEAAMIDALRTGRIAGAGLDVYDREPLPADHPLRSCPNTVLTPHIGFVTEQGYRDFYARIIERILAWRAGEAFGVAPTNRA